MKHLILMILLIIHTGAFASQETNKDLYKQIFTRIADNINLEAEDLPKELQLTLGLQASSARHAAQRILHCTDSLRQDNTVEELSTCFTKVFGFKLEELENQERFFSRGGGILKFVSFWNLYGTDPRELRASYHYDRERAVKILRFLILGRSER